MEPYISEYSSRWGEFSEFLDVDIQKEKWDKVVAIPACRESVLLPRLLDSILQSSDALKIAVVIVVNHTETASEEIKQDNQKTLEFLCADVKKRMSYGVLWCFWKNYDLFVIDRASPGRELPHKQGVGLARKISCDFALLLPQFSCWIRTTDADAVLPEDYWIDPIEAEGAAAWRWPYEHIRTGRGQCDKAIHLYELFLQIWEQGLSYAKSPYAWQAMGSCLGLSRKYYAMVRGYPLKQAGEDFYVLNKLQKVGNVVAISHVQPIQLESRISDRVPFGTGAAMQNLINTFERQQKYQIYHPQTFYFLKILLECAENAIEKQSCDDWDSFFSDDIREIHKIMKIDQALLRAIKHHSKNRNQHFHVWFDAFRTMKWMHSIRDKVLGLIDIDIYLEHGENEELRLKSLPILFSTESGKFKKDE
ncbi:MAG: hypothetical protein AB8C84_00385 [Oligoflexales bacterium]